MTNYSFEPVAIPRAEDLPDRTAHEETPGATSGDDPPRAEPADLRLPEFSRTGAGSPTDSGPPADGAEARLEQARAEAHARGVEEGRRGEGERVRTALEAVRSAVDDLRKADERREVEATDRIATLATAIASHLIEREVRTAPDIVSDLVRRAIAEFPVTDGLAVHLNPSDLALLSSGLAGDSSGEQLTSGHTVRWVPDPSIRSGGCLVEGGDRVVDARLSRILERVLEALTDG